MRAPSSKQFRKTLVRELAGKSDGDFLTDAKIVCKGLVDPRILLVLHPSEDPYGEYEDSLFDVIGACILQRTVDAETFRAIYRRPKGAFDAIQRAKLQFLMRGDFIAEQATE